MQQFTVPQFIDVEDKIIGPITTRQFIIMLAGFVTIGISYKIFDFSLFLVCAILDFAICCLFAFLKVNGRPFHLFVLNFIQTSKKPFLRVWSNIIGKTEYDYQKFNKTIAEEKPTVLSKQYNISRLTELSLVVDTQGAYQGEEQSDQKLIKANTDK